MNIVNDIVEVTLKDMRKIRLVSLHQLSTYGRWLCGLPTPYVNNMAVKEIIENAVHALQTDLPVLLIEPQAGGISYSEMSEDDGMAPCESLPRIATCALFHSKPTAPNVADADFSGAILVWFQDHWGLPNLPTVEQIKMINWDDKAQDIEF